MNAGRELDREIAERVMGWRVLSEWEPGVVKRLIDENQCEVHPPIFKQYSTSIADAWEVVEALEKRFEIPIFSLVHPHEPKREWVCILADWKMDLRECSGYADTAPHAICLAALKAIAHDRT